MLRARPRRAPPEAGKGKEQPSPGERGSDALPSPAHGAKAAGTPREGTGGEGTGGSSGRRLPWMPVW